MSSKRPFRICNQYSIGLITALAIELTAINAMLDERHDYPQDSDDNNYQFSRIGSHNVVIAALPRKSMEKVSAATTATQMAKTFPHIRFGLFVGIGGVVPNLDAEQDVRLGDIVVGIPGGTSGGTVQYKLGKLTSQGFKRTRFLQNHLKSSWLESNPYKQSMKDRIPKYLRSLRKSSRNTRS
ncbi:hypothetical protein IWZ03DRAFT_23436 [Phyllosticta citriasiana]|uniref:Uncharacterized protein n=1 Tax=Phyllosticta citriasiana TaxID=595635 RepID=A0ABR1L1R2_9PEZI